MHPPSATRISLISLLIFTLLLKVTFEEYAFYDYYKTTLLLLILLIIPLLKLKIRTFGDGRVLFFLVSVSVALFWVNSLSIGNTVRYSSVFMEPSVFATFLYTYYIVLSRPFFYRNLVILFGIAMSFTMGVILPFVLSVLSNYHLTHKQKVISKLILLVAFLVLFIVVQDRFSYVFDLMFGSVSLDSKINYAQYYGADNLGARFRIIHWMNITLAALDNGLYDILFGQSKEFYVLLGDDHKPHNDYILVFVNTGVLGLLAFIYVLYSMYKDAQSREDRIKILFLCLSISVTNFVDTMLFILTVSIFI